MILNNVEVMFGGQAGDGSLTTGDLIAGVFKHMGLEVYTYKDFPSRIRGGHTNYVIRAGEKPNYGMADFVDGLVAFDLEAVEKHIDEIRSGGFIIFDNTHDKLTEEVRRPDVHFYEVPLAKIAKEEIGLELVRNTVSLGALSRLIGMDAETVLGDVTSVYQRKGEKVVDLNIRAIQAGEKYVDDHFDRPSGYGLTKAVDGDRLRLRQVISSRGAFPVSITVHDDAVYVLNALGGGSIQGYFNARGRLIPIRGWNRSLGLDPTATPQFTHTPGQVAFSPDGHQLIVTTKANTNAIDVFGIGRSGRPSAAPVVNTEPGAVPFAVTFDRAGHLVVAEAGTNSLVTFGLNTTGTLTQIDAVASTQQATCWVEPAGAYLFAGNAGGNGTPGFGSLSGYTSSPTGQLTNLGATVTDPGTVDSSATPDGRYLYTQTGANGIVDEFAVNANGSLTGIGSVTVANAVGGEGIVAL